METFSALPPSDQTPPAAQQASPSSGALQGRKVEPVFTTSDIVILAVAVAFAALLITFACLTGNHTIEAPDWLVKTLKGAAGVVGTAQVLFIPFLIAHYFEESKHRQHSANLLAALQPEIPPVPPNALTIPNPSPSIPVDSNAFNSLIPIDDDDSFNLNDPLNDIESD